jgi:membrane-bound lytic murein transglycosylase B
MTVRPAVLPWLLTGLAALLAAPAAEARPHHARPAAASSDNEPDVVTYGRREDVVAFARQLDTQQGLDDAGADALIAQLAQARYQPAVARLIMPPPSGTAKNWAAYRSRFVEPQHVRAGLRFWDENQRWLDAAETRWGVPPEIVTALVGVESFYGRVLGNFRVLDALATLSFDFPAGRSDRSAFYRDELGAFLAWCRAEGRDPVSVKGSYAGAIGLPQFMPGSIRDYAVDFDGDGRIDLEHAGADVVGSVANYFARYGWQRGLPTHYAVAAPTDTVARATLLAPDIQPSFSAAQMGSLGAVLEDAARDHPGPLALVELQNGGLAPSYVAGTRNFYVITRYNWSSYYAMAVIDLASELRRRHAPPPPVAGAPQTVVPAEASASAPHLQ